jgi:hypothetical protein
MAGLGHIQDQAGSLFTGDVAPGPDNPRTFMSNSRSIAVRRQRLGHPPHRPFPPPQRRGLDPPGTCAYSGADSPPALHSRTRSVHFDSVSVMTARLRYAASDVDDRVSTGRKTSQPDGERYDSRVIVIVVGGGADSRGRFGCTERRSDPTCQ